jgi:hypothetical protein
VKPDANATTLGYDLFGRDTAGESLGFESRTQSPGWFQYSETDALLEDLATPPGPTLHAAGPENIYRDAYVDPDRELTRAFVEAVGAKVGEEVNERVADTLVKLFIKEAETAGGPELWLVTQAVEKAVEKLREVPEAGLPIGREFEDTTPGSQGPVPRPRPGPVADNADPNEQNHWLFLP